MPDLPKLSGSPDVPDFRNTPRVNSVVPGSIAEEGGISPGDELISIDGERITDIFDYLYLTSSRELELLVRSADGNEWTLEIEKDEDEDIGIIFNSELLDTPRVCKNRCVFCFIDQLPRGMRESLYFKDDDVRLTFTNGNYVTLTNVGRDELSRIVRYRLSPVNISVHTTDAALRAKMLGRGDCPPGQLERYDILPKIKYLTESGIAVNVQIVLCRHYNDGAVLDATLCELGKLNDYLISVSVVPSGLTKFRDDLPLLEAFDVAAVKTTLRQISRRQKAFLVSRGSRTVFAADEFYVLSGTRTPGHAAYEGYPQLENGVGMMTLFKKQFNDGLISLKRKIEFEQIRARAATIPPLYIFTGYAAAGMLKQCVAKIVDIMNGLRIEVIPVENCFFGEKITVTGLLTGEDILKRAKTVKFLPNSRILISKTMLKHNTDMLLDNYTLKTLREKLKVGIIAVENDGRSLIRALLYH